MKQTDTKTTKPVETNAKTVPAKVDGTPENAIAAEDRVKTTTPRDGAKVMPAGSNLTNVLGNADMRTVPPQGH